MIPRIIHQTWKTDRIPEQFQAYAHSWHDFNPGWEVILWSDRMLLDFVAAHYPELLATYCSYLNGVQRADAARYMLLHHFGGLYADLDAECLAPCEMLVSEDRVVLCQEPRSQWAQHIRYRRQLPYLLFNGVMASPAGHPFWRELLDMLPVMVSARDVLDSTGPCLLTGVEIGSRHRAEIAVHSCHLFNGVDVWGKEADDDALPRAPALARHHWAGTWYTHWRRPNLFSRAKRIAYRCRDVATRGRRLDVAAAKAAVDPTALAAPPSPGNRLTILVPVRNGADQIGPFLGAVAALDYPKSDIRLVFCEGDSVDGSFERLKALTAPLKQDYRDVVLLRKSIQSNIPSDRRWQRSLQRTRRSGIARVRNHLIDHGISEHDDWVLWIDIDVWSFPPDIVRTLRSTNHRIVCPNCVLRPGGSTFDGNSFVEADQAKTYRYYRSVHRGLYMPPANVASRLVLSDLRYLDWVELDAVGGTMLLVDAALHRGGLRFPELPYRRLIETEGLGALAKDLGITPIGLPKVEILHSPW